MMMRLCAAPTGAIRCWIGCRTNCETPVSAVLRAFVGLFGMLEHAAEVFVPPTAPAAPKSFMVMNAEDISLA